MIDGKTHIRSSLMIMPVMLPHGVGGQTVLGQRPADGAVPAGLERFYGQELTFGSCEPFTTTALEELLYVDPFQCGRIQVRARRPYTAYG